MLGKRQRASKKKRGRRIPEMQAEETLSTMTFTLNNGNKMPKFGLGTYKIRKPDVLEQVVDAALAEGYRLFDTAPVYENEAALGAAFRKLLPKYNLKRDDIFVTTKLPPTDLGNVQAIVGAYEKSLENLGMDYVDLYLIHFPSCSKISSHDERNAKLRRATWQCFTKLYDEGRVNSIGVSNFTVRHLEELGIKNSGVVPAVNQVEWHPYYYQNEMRDYCRKNDICVQAYGSLGGSGAPGRGALLAEPVVRRVADECEVSAAQVLLAWALHHDVAVIPKCSGGEHVRDNAAAMRLRLTDAQVRALDALGANNTKYAWDPSDVR